MPARSSPVRTALLTVALVSAGPALFAQAHLGPELRVNTFTPGTQMVRGRSLGTDADGNFVIVWESYQPASDYDVHAQRFDARGNPRGSEFRVNAWTTDRQSSPKVAVDPFGNFVVAWTSAQQDGSAYGVFAQRYDASGAPRGAEFRVNTATFLDQFVSDVSVDGLGRFVIVWFAVGLDPGRGVYAQRYDASGAPRGAEFRVNTYTPGDQDGATLAHDGNGGFVVTWTSGSQDGSGNGIFGQRFDDAGNPLGGEFRVNSYTTGNQDRARVAASADGSFVVAWSSADQDGDRRGVFAQRFAPSGPPVGSEFQVNTFTESDQHYPSAAMDAGGNFVVAWDSNWQDGDAYGVFARAFTAAGESTAEFRINTYTTSQQIFTTVALRSGGRFMVSWASYGQDGSGWGVYAQRMNAGIVPSALAVDDALAGR